MQKKALGRGLEVLIPVARPLTAVAYEEREQIVQVPVALIAANPYQPRRVFNQTTLQELADSFKTQGVIQPVLVRRLGDGQFQLIAGERRLRAAKLAGLAKISVLVPAARDSRLMENGTVENLQRRD